ncbi:hypothetical protein ACQUQU_02005 [Thalassolituus sp. LLYu03]|uniref:hypothetical protein n=1 Tax=Thalassolituus sp. LLYu03 TaxID=3421656 RepID=UPI003D28656A
MNLKNWWRHPKAQTLISAYLALSARERVLTAITLNAALAFVLLTLLIWPQIEAMRAAYQISASVSAENSRLQARLDELRTAVVVDPNEPLRAELARNASQQALLDERITALTRSLIPPAEMTRLLGNVLAQNKDLTPVGLVSMPVERVTLGEGFADVELYRHRLHLQARATYSALVNYLQALDQQPWVIGWEMLSFDVGDYPNGEFELEVSALSRQQEVLGGR